jgi:tetratricopeptide (TPR) repeat protein
LGVATAMIRDGQNLNFAIPSENIPPLRTGKRYLLPEYADRYVNGVVQQVAQEFTQQLAEGRSAGRMDCSSSIARLEQALQVKPSHAGAWLFIGSCAAVMKAFDDANWRKWQDEAVYAYRQAIRYSPAEAEAYRGLGNILRLGQPSDAAMAYRKLIELKPEDVDAHKGLAAAYQELKQYAAAIDEYKWVLERQVDVDVLIDEGSAYEDAEMKNEALVSYQRAVHLKPDYARAHFMLGKFYAYRLKKKKLAIAELRILKPLNPKMADDLAMMIDLFR